MAEKKGIVARRPGVAASRPTTAPAPPPAEDDDPFGMAEEAPPAPAQPAAPVTKRAAVTLPARRPRPVAAPPPAEEKGASTFEKYGTKGMPEAERIATGARGSEVFGVPPPKSSGGPEEVLDSPQSQVAARPGRVGAPAARGGLKVVAPVEDGPLVGGRPAPFLTVEDAIEFIRDTNKGNYVNLSDARKERRDLALRVIIADLVTRRTTVAEVLFEHELGSDVLALGDETQGQIANAVAETAAGSAHETADSFAGDWAAEEFGAEGAAPPQRGPLYTSPAGTKVTFDELVNIILQYARASYKWQGQTDRQLGVEIGKTFRSELSSIKGEEQTATKENMARRVATALIESWGAAPEPEGGPDGGGGGPEEDGGEWDDPEDDGSSELQVVPIEEVEGGDETPRGVVRQMAAGRSGASAPAGPPDEDALKFKFDGEKVALGNRANALICGNCKESAREHKGLKGATKGGCPGFVPANKPSAQEHAALLRDTAAFKEKWADRLAPKRVGEGNAAVGERGEVAMVAELGSQGGVAQSPGQPHLAADAAVSRVGHRQERVEGQSGGAGPAVPKSAGVVASVRGAGGRAGVASAPGVAAGQGRGAAVGQLPERVAAAEDGRSSGPDEEAFGGVSESPDGAEQGASGGGVQGGDDVPPAEYRADAEEQRRAWAAEAGGEFTSKLTWAINYPPNGENLAAPTALALDQASVERRNRVTEKVETYIAKHLFGGHGQLRDDVEYGSPGWRAFVAGRRLASACEEYAANRYAENEEVVQNKVQRAVKDYVLAHYLLPEGTPDPYFNEYVEMCLAAQRPIGTPVEELMAGQ